LRDQVTLKPGDKVLHRYNRDLGPGEVLAVEGGRLRVRFPRRDETMEFAARDHAFVPLVLPEGTDPARWHESFHEDMIERLARLEVDRLAAWENRMDSLRLARLREADGLGSFLGGRIRIFPHQLHVAEQAVRTDPVRWLLADEVGLGKTVEACLILNRLLRTGRAERVLIVAPASLTVQWLGELYRKFHQIFVLLDEERRRDVRKDFGPEWNPFEVHPRSVIALEDLVDSNDLVRRAEAAKPDLLVVDEAHHLERRAGHPGSPSYRAVAPLAAASRNVLLLSATPLEADAHGFFRLLGLLRPEEYGSWEEFRARLDAGTPLYPCTSATRRADIGGLPPRVPLPVDLAPWPEMEAIESAILTEPATDRLAEIRRAERLERAMDAPTGDDDPRLRWVLDQYPAWKKSGDKILLFVARRESLEFLKGAIERATLQRVGVFHEDLTPAARDLEVAQFAQADGPILLISTESGGEGRNFEFCRCLVLFDLPWDPVLLEQRIGRLDRISRTRPVEVCYFRPPGGLAAQVARLYEALGIFREPLGGLDRSLHHVEEAIRSATLSHPPQLDVEAVVRETHEARARMNRALYHDLHRNRYRPELAPGILARIPSDLERRTAEVVLEACGQFGFETVAKGSRATWYIEFGSESVVESLPGVAEGTRWLGTFDREEAVRRETLDFFASGHPLVEGILLELEDGHRGQIAMLEVRGTGVTGGGVLAMVKRGAEFEAVVVDLKGRRHPEWARFFTEERGARREGDPLSWGLAGAEALAAWAPRARELLHPLQREGKLVAAAAFRLLPD
jgi:ATP-dependent helicase HepA